VAALEVVRTVVLAREVDATPIADESDERLSPVIMTIELLISPGMAIVVTIGKICVIFIPLAVKKAVT
jgi:hypothetical protein